MDETQAAQMVYRKNKKETGSMKKKEFSFLG
jgi:hypothetical protein